MASATGPHVNSRSTTRPHRRARWAALVLLALTACSSPPQHFALLTDLRALPEAGPGASLAVEQRVGTTESLVVGFTLGFEFVPLDEEGPLGDDWKRAFAGLTLRGEDEAGPHAATGVNWVRTDGAVQGLESFGDYGGLYLEVGYDWRLASGLATGPLALGAWLDAEGDRTGSGGFAELAWRIAWRF